MKWGTWKKISDLDRFWNKKNLKLCDIKTKTTEESDVLCFMQKEEIENIYEIKTKFNNTIMVTGDHPILTTDGMINADKLHEKDNVITHPFSGVEFEEPTHEIILQESHIDAVLDELNIDNKGNAKGQIKSYLRKLGLLEIRYDSEKLPILLKIIGFVLGDGVISFVNKRKGFVHFYAKREDLKEIQSDIKELGFECPNIFERLRNHSIDTYYGNQKFDFNETSIMKKSTAFAVLLVALGAPYGKKVTKSYRVPKWVLNAPLWQKRLFLAAFFGAELSKPSTLNKYNFYEPQLNMNKLEKLKESAIDFLNDIRLILSEFNVQTSYPVDVDGYQYNGKDGKTCGIRLKIKSNMENLIRFFGTVGYEYNKNKKAEACYAKSYLEMKKVLIEAKISVNISEGIILKTLPRVGTDFISYEDFKNSNVYGEEGFVIDEIRSIKLLPYSGFVYDLTMNDSNHNFIANSLVVSNCGMRLITTNLKINEVKPKLRELVDTFFRTVPAGVGVKGFVKINRSQFDDVMTQGVRWCVENGYGWEEDIERVEEHGVIKGADPAKVSDKAKSRGLDQIGTLGSGNHYLEVQLVAAENIFDQQIAERFGIFKDQVVVMVHCGSRGFGHQIGTDYLRIFDGAMKKYNINVNDKELACAPFSSKEGQDYYAAMACAANMAFVNRQVILHRIREGFSKVFKRSAEDLGMHMIYDVAHNIAKVEEHKVGNKTKKVLVHRKGSTRSFAPNHPELAKLYRDVGQPVIIGGSMETGSFLLVGTDKAMDETFGSTAHGSGRTMSRTQAKREVSGDQLQKDMEKRGIYVRAVSMSGLAEEAGRAYKDINDVIDAVSKAGISKPVVGLKPIGNVKG